MRFKDINKSQILDTQEHSIYEIENYEVRHIWFK